MNSRAAIAVTFVALFAYAQPSVWVDVVPDNTLTTTENPTDSSEDVEKRYTAELVEELESVKADALLIYTEFTARASAELKMFIRNISSFSNDTYLGVDPTLLNAAPERCRSEFSARLKKIASDARRAAGYSGENHHKFFLGHIIVFRMHLNKSEDYINKCERVIKSCGIKCETTSKMVRWRRLAANELNRVRDDLQHSRAMYRDLLTHAHRKLNTLHRQASAKGTLAVDQLRVCANT